jgi:hypothetical protein
VTTPVILTAVAQRHNYAHNQVVPFSHVIVDSANMYDRTTGVVTIPRTGSYFIYLR